MQDSELGEIPKGWRVEFISKLFDVKDGTHDSPKYQINGYNLITSKHLKENGQIDFQSANKISGTDFIDINKRSKVDYLDVLFTMIGTVGNILIVSDESIDFAIKNIGLFKTSQNKKLIHYAYYYLRSDFSEKYFKERLSGSTQQYVTLKTLRELPIIIPDDNIINIFNQILHPIFEIMKNNNQQTNNIISIRDSLLPKLMNGEIEA